MNCQNLTNHHRCKEPNDPIRVRSWAREDTREPVTDIAFVFLWLAKKPNKATLINFCFVEWLQCHFYLLIWLFTVYFQCLFAVGRFISILVSVFLVPDKMLFVNLVSYCPMLTVNFAETINNSWEKKSRFFLFPVLAKEKLDNLFRQKASSGKSRA